MGTFITVVISLGIGFWVGHGFASHRRHGAFLLSVLVTVFAVLFSVLGLAGIIQFASPTAFIELLGMLPGDYKELAISDLFMGGPRLWVFVIVAGALWWVKTRI